MKLAVRCADLLTVLSPQLGLPAANFLMAAALVSLLISAENVTLAQQKSANKPRPPQASQATPRIASRSPIRKTSERPKTATAVDSVDATPQVVEFQRRPTEVGETSRQFIECGLNAERKIWHEKQVVETASQTIQRSQERVLKILEVAHGRPIRAEVTYHVSGSRFEDPNGNGSTVTQPVEGHTYHIQRNPDDPEAALEVLDEAGNIPPDQELAIVRQNLHGFGKPNPLAEFLHGRRIAVGETLKLPPEVAQELLGFAGSDSESGELQLRLVSVWDEESVRCGIFETEVRAVPANGPGEEKREALSMIMKGKLSIDTANCRTRGMELAGPVAISERMGTGANQFLVSTSGSMKLKVRVTD